MRRKVVVFSKMFVLRSMGNELVPSPIEGTTKNLPLKTNNNVKFSSWIYLVVT